MNNVYDNGAIMLGDLTMVISEIEKEMKENVDMCFCDMDELLKELKELLEVDKHMIVSINYENPMGYDYTCWTQNDKIEVKNEKE